MNFEFMAVSPTEEGTRKELQGTAMCGSLLQFPAFFFVCGPEGSLPHAKCNHHKSVCV